MTPRLIEKVVGEFDSSEFEGSLIELKNLFHSYIVNYGDEVRLNYVGDCHNEYDSFVSSKYDVVVDRMETAAECERRENLEAEKLAYDTHIELAQYKKLHEKYGNK